MNGKEKTIHTFAGVWLILFLLSILPLLVIGWYDVPAADDYSMGLQAGVAFRQTNNPIITIIAAIEKTKLLYKSWNGNYTSALLAALPPHTWGEQFYRITPILSLTMLCMGTVVLIFTIFKTILKQDRSVTFIVSTITLFMSIQCIPKTEMRVELLYWYSGAVNYTVMYGVGLLWLAVMLRLFYSTDNGLKPHVSHVIAASFLGIIAGGANYMTALTLAVLAMLGIILRIVKSKRLSRAIIPCVFLLIGFTVSCLAPGNRIRGQAVEYKGEILGTIINAMSDTVLICINDWTGIMVIFLLLMLVPFFWMTAGKTKYMFRYPALFVLFAFCLTSVNIMPPLYATGSIGSGRIMGLLWLQYILLLVLTEGYCIGWLRRLIETDLMSNISPVCCLRNYIIALSAFTLIAMTLFTLANPSYFTYSQAVVELSDGCPKKYAVQFNSRLKELYDPEKTKIIFTEYESIPSLIYFSDITEDADDWTNRAMANYYGKESIIIK